MFQTIISTISSFMYSKLLVILLIGAGVYFTIRTKFPQVRLFKNACGSVMEKPEDKGAISSFQALMVSTASRVGTGNIVGVSSARNASSFDMFSGDSSKTSGACRNRNRKYRNLY